MSSIPDDSDRALLSRAAAGDRRSFGALYDRHVRAVYWQAYAVLREAGEAEEVTQDAFVTLWRRIDEISIVDESVLPWLLTTSRYTALNARRRQATGQQHRALHEIGDVGSPHSVEDDVLAAHVRAEIARAVSALSPVDRDLYELCVVGEHSYDSAALELGVTHGAVRNRLSRLKSRLRTDLRTVREPS